MLYHDSFNCEPDILRAVQPYLMSVGYYLHGLASCIWTMCFDFSEIVFSFLDSTINSRCWFRFLAVVSGLEEKANRNKCIFMPVASQLKCDDFFWGFCVEWEGKQKRTIWNWIAWKPWYIPIGLRHQLVKSTHQSESVECDATNFQGSKVIQKNMVDSINTCWENHVSH